MSPDIQAQKYKACLIGCGKMGGAMLRGWLQDDAVASVFVVDPTPIEPAFLDDQRVTYNDQVKVDALSDIDVLILAVKPQVLADACGDLGNVLPAHCLVLSIAAGQSLERLEHVLGSRSIVRSMPNTPAAVAKGISAAIGNSHCHAEDLACAQTLLSAVGDCVWLDDESDMDRVTALSGSGPAYVFYMIEALAKAGEQIGLDQELAMKLARQTVIGSAALAENDHETPASVLRENVTSPNGTTQAALDVLMDGRYQDVLTQALDAARKRSIALNS